MTFRSAPLFAAFSLALSAPAGAAGVAPDALTPNQPQVTALPSSYRAIPVEMAMQTQPMFAPGGAALPIYLNRWGGTYVQGWDNSANNTSSIVDGGSATITPFGGTENQWSEVLSCVQDQFEAFNVYVTDVEPVQGNYIEAVVAGSPDQLGMPYGVGGVAPFDPYGCQIIDQAVVYAFADVYLQGGWGGGTRALCETATQEIAHAMTLDHVLICEDPLTYLNGCGEKTFQDEYGTCGEYEPRECSCQRPSQNSVQVLLEVLGPSDGSEPPPPVDDQEAPSVALLSPADGDTFVADTEIAIVAEVSDDVALTLVQLFWENNDLLLPCPGEGGGWSCNQSGDTFTWRVSPGLGSRSFSVQARDVVGNTTSSDSITIFLTEDGEPMPEDLMLPDVALVSPLQGAELEANSQITVVATASDDVGISSVVLEWDYSGEAFPCPINTQNVQCEAEGSTYTWQILVGDGERVFRARARDLVGNEVVTEDRSFVLVQNPAAAPVDDLFEDNDTWDQSATVACGDELDLIALGGDDDWFRLQVPADMGVRVAVSGEVAESLEVGVRTGPFSGSSIGSGTGSEIVELIPEVTELGVLIEAGEDVYGSYTLSVSCVDAADINPPTTPGNETPSEGDPDVTPGIDVGGLDLVGGCSTTSAHSGGRTLPGFMALGLLSLAGLLRRRRR